MKKSDLYEIAIKISGLYLVTIFISRLTEIFTFISAYLQEKNNPDLGRISVFLIFCFGFILLIVFIWILLFRTRQVAKLICKPADRTEDVKLFAEKKTIYEICLVLLGLITIVFILPDFIFQFKNYITLIQNDFPLKPYNKNFLVTSGIKLAIGILAIVYATQISGYLAKKKIAAKADNS